MANSVGVQRGLRPPPVIGLGTSHQRKSQANAGVSVAVQKNPELISIS